MPVTISTCYHWQDKKGKKEKKKIKDKDAKDSDADKPDTSDEKKVNSLLLIIAAEYMYMGLSSEGYSSKNYDGGVGQLFFIKGRGIIENFLVMMS